MISRFLRVACFPVVFSTLSCLLLAMPNTANAYQMLGSFTHDYGRGPGKVDPGGNDILRNDFVWVSDQSTERFNDVFDFSSLTYNSIEQFELTLSFSHTNGRWLWEDWNARPGDSDDLFDLERSWEKTSQSFIIDSTVDTFSAMVAAQEFDLWFAEQTWGCDHFKLYDAQLDVYGVVPTPEPGTLLLVGSGLLGGYLVKRRRKAKATA